MTLDVQSQPGFTEKLIPRDAVQASAIALLEELATALTLPQQRQSTGVLDKLLGRADSFNGPEGIYLWGGVGRGKTWLMDRFYDAVPIDAKVRLHFHHFLQYIHKEQQRIAPQSNPLDAIAREFAAKYRLLCLDEYQVGDIGDAMLLYGIFKGLFRYGVTLVTTSNRHPDHLYKGGVQQEQILPSIMLLKKHTRIFHLDGDVDYRLEHDSGVFDGFITPHDAHAEKKLETCFQRHATGIVHTDGLLEISQRTLPALKYSDNCAWFEFDVLCRGPRSVSDYIQLAVRFDVLIVSAVPVLHEELESSARRFLNLIDELYDREIRLVLSSHVPLERLYQGEKLNFEFQRAASRLYQMQTRAYLAALPEILK